MITGFGGTALAVTDPAGNEVVSGGTTQEVIVGTQVAFTANNIFVSLSSGTAKEFTPLGVEVQTIDCSGVANSFTTGSVFDSDMNFYMTMFDGNDVCKVDPDNTSAASFGGPYSGSTESILIDAAGNFYVGAVDGDNDIRKFLSDGTPDGQFDVATEDRGSDWIDLAADQCTMFYTSEGFRIFRYDVCTDTQLADFASSPNSPLFALRLLDDGGLLVANQADIKRFDSTGAVIDTYDVTGNGGWFALNLDSDGETFWSADAFTNEVCRFNIATGGGLNNQDICWNAGAGGLFGLTVKGELTIAICPPGTEGVPPDCTPIEEEGECGDGVKDSDEQCDDGNTENGDGCNSQCRFEAVGGEFLPIDTTALLVAGAQSNALWILTTLAVIGSVAFGALYLTTRRD